MSYMLLSIHIIPRCIYHNSETTNVLLLHSSVYSYLNNLFDSYIYAHWTVIMISVWKKHRIQKNTFSLK